MRAPRGRSAGMADTRIGTMPLSVRYLHLRRYPQALYAGSQNIAHSDDAVGSITRPAVLFVRYRTLASIDLLHARMCHRR